ncbi:asparagine synthetase B [Salinirubellus salinus]|uniref:Asparagine synthetase B n=1 Tax=Salinirubellus salinus TaxID=1364945 RepID=A0A9E7U5N0_9EURY|nr:asparagine synthetase B [Salinirubellus salinus]UWM55575.1 asparagine synthetase B [Salinirubellus salinus]
MTWHVHGNRQAAERGAADRDPLVGTDVVFQPCRGYAYAVDREGGTAIGRDVLGRYPIYYDRERSDRWAFDPTELDAPELLPAGTMRVLPNDPDHEAAPEAERLFDLPRGSPDHDDPSAVSLLLHRRLNGAFADVEREARREDHRVAVAFSGGVDSAVVAAGLREERRRQAADDAAPEPSCYVVGFPDSQDVAVARETAAALDLHLRVVELTHATLERAVPEVARAIGRTNPMDVSIALPLYLAGERAAAEGYTHLAVGQGADELFGGYQKVVDPAGDHRVEAETVRGARRETMLSLPEQLPRDVLALRAAGVEPVAPFLDDRVVDLGLHLAPECIVEGDRRKVALREAAHHRLPEAVAERDKKAVQYGSNVSRELDRLARRAGFKRRMDDHVGQYVRSLL